MSDAGTAGISATDTDLVLTDVVVTESALEGLDSIGGSLTVQNSSFTGNGGTGIFISAPVDQNIVITETVVDDNAFHGLDIYAAGTTSITISSLTVNGNVGTGLVVELHGEVSFVITDTEVSGNDDDGTDIWAYDEVTIDLTRPTLDGNGLGNLVLQVQDEAEAVLSEVEAVNADSDSGFELRVEDDAWIGASDIVATGNGFQGIDITVLGGAVSIDRARVLDNSQGIAVEANPGTVRIWDSTVADNWAGGVSIGQFGGNIELNRVTVSGSAGTGIIAGVTGNTPLVLRSSTVSGNEAGGTCVPSVYVDAADTTSVELLYSTIRADADENCPQVGFVGGRYTVSHTIFAGTG